ncbi:capsular polysaccharide biosynthesis protein [Chitiniphilus shinanonensis]
MLVGWGGKSSAVRAGWYARRRGDRLLCVEDGFLRSFGAGKRYPALSLVMDDQGAYYDSACANRLEGLLNSDKNLLHDHGEAILRAKALLLSFRLSKYNHAPDWAGDPPAGNQPAVLVVDQTFGDLSVMRGGADRHTFAAMLAAARAENPGAVIYVKTHPEVSSGHKGGYLTQVRADARTVLLRHPINPYSLLDRMDRVYVVSSTLGFEALLAGKPVTCFGRPWYAGWGPTDDRQPCARRARRRSVDELFAAAYFHYARYLDPITRTCGTIFDVIDWLILQRQVASQFAGTNGRQRMIGVGFPRWKQANVRPFLGLDPKLAQFAPSAAAAQCLEPKPGDRLLCWGATPPAGLMALAKGCWAHIVHMEDGFVRSVGLGSDLIRPLSLVLDERGIYFDATRPSDLEHLLNTACFSRDELARAGRVRQFIVEHGITKYNMEPRKPAAWPSGGRPIVLVPGQVEDDASIRYGCTHVRTNLGLLRAVRNALPGAFIVYKPHPDVVSGNRAGRLGLADAASLADHIETELSVVSCIEACDAVHTMTSLTGFDALLRGKPVVTYGQPFYAGWGLTQDRLGNGPAFRRRTRKLTLDELVAGALLRYPVYWDWELNGYTTCEAVLRRIVEIRDAQEREGGLERLRTGYWRRQLRKLRILIRAWSRST